MSKKVIIGLSGGVDSAVAAARLLEQGYDVHAFFMKLENPGQAPHESENKTTDPTAQALADARRVAAFLGIPPEKFHVWELVDRFERGVIDPFVQAYASGLTPNPCVRCNRVFKFGYVVQRALREGFDYVATGHYARLDHLDTPVSDQSVTNGGKNGGGLRYMSKARPFSLPFVTAAPEYGLDFGLAPDEKDCEFPHFRLRRGASLAKDQSYVLAGARAEMLAHAIFPLWDVRDKSETRAEAERRGLPVAHKRDSFDICFIHDGDTRGFLRGRLGGAQPGAIVDEEGAVVGQHQGAFLYTVGQRRGLHLPRPHADGQPRYVTRVDVGRNVVQVGPLETLDVHQIQCGRINWLVEPSFGRRLLVASPGSADAPPPADSADSRGASPNPAVNSEPESPDLCVHNDSYGHISPKTGQAPHDPEPLTSSFTNSNTVTKPLCVHDGEDGHISPKLTVQFRAHSHPEPATFEIDERDELLVIFPPEAVIRGVAPGQSLVVYQGDTVIAQAEIMGTQAR